MSEAAVRLVGLRKVFGGRGGAGGEAVVAVDSIDLEVRDGEFFAMLGPSGSGKTTVLRMIAGFETPTAGRVHLGGRDVTRDAPFDRDVNTVFQDYALFPHMTVLQNVAYGLMVKGVARAERRARAEEALASVRLEGYGGRRPGQLSGGQRQRVALARALVNRPRVLLLDEPLGALDLKLREQMQVELKGIQRDVGITFLFVTHDQEEALTMSDRIAVFNEGRIEQVGTASEVYERPASAFVAGFVGSSNLLEGEPAMALLGDPRAGLLPTREGPDRPGRRCARRRRGRRRRRGDRGRLHRRGDPGHRPAGRRGRGAGAGAEHRRDDRRRAVGRGDRVQVGFNRAHVYRVTTKNASATGSVAEQGEATNADRVRGAVSQGGNT